MIYYIFLLWAIDGDSREIARVTLATAWYDPSGPARKSLIDSAYRVNESVIHLCVLF